MKSVGIGGGLGVKGVEEGFVLWNACRFIKRSALLGMVHKMGLGMRNLALGNSPGWKHCFCMSENISINNVRCYRLVLHG